MDQAFKHLEAILVVDVLMAYPNHNIPFYFYTDASNYQMGAIFVQLNHPVVYWSKKLNIQQNYHKMEEELFDDLQNINK